MDFRTATDELFERVDQAELASRLGVSIALIRQARLRPDAAAHRTAPEKWQTAVYAIAKDRSDRYRKLAETLAMESDISDS